MIVQVWQRAMEAGVGRVAVAAAEAEIVDAVAAAGGEAVLTDPELPSGSDRIWAALSGIDPDARHDCIVNLQGDLPTIAPADIQAVLQPLADPAVDIATLATEITRDEERDNPNVVKAVIAQHLQKRNGLRTGRALYFTRATAPAGEGPLFHHIGIYAYRRAALAQFVGMPPSPLEMREKLEQLRALEAGMRIDIACIDTLPLGVDTPADLERARQLLG